MTQKAPVETATEPDAQKAFERFKKVVSMVASVPKDEVDALEERRPKKKKRRGASGQ